ncbi:MAG: ImmA/IrrE family metallo-endopeptidase, partial [Sedimenticola sp.]
AISEIIKGHKAITPETALQLEEVVGISAHIWSGLEADYQLAKAREEFARQVEAEAATVTRFPYPEMSKMGLVKATRNRIEKVKELRRYFGVASLVNLAKVRSYAPAFRQTNKGKVSHEALAAWLRAGELEARRIKTEPFDSKRLKARLPELRELTREPPARFGPQLKALLAECGVALVLLPHLPKTYTNGATFWLGKEKAVLMMTLRGSWADIFWFSLFHELGHILLHDKRHVFLEDGDPDTKWQQQENEADQFAQQALIPTKAYQRFLNETPRFTKATVKAFADFIGTCPGIITGRLQHDKKLPHTHHMHRSRLKWAEGE